MKERERALGREGGAEKERRGVGEEQGRERESYMLVDFSVILKVLGSLFRTHLSAACYTWVLWQD
jgi:hypothetical protein